MYKVLTYKKISVAVGVVCVFAILITVIFYCPPVRYVFSNSSVKLAVIMYHQISENSAIWGNYVIPSEMLREDFAYMKKCGYHPVSTNDLKEFINGDKRLPDNPVLITFDDGERTFLTKVVPLLEEFNYPAVVSVVGSLTDLYTENGDTNDKYAYLNWDDMKELSKNPLVEIGNHSYNMHSLGNRRGMGKIYGENETDYRKALADDFSLIHSEFTEYLGSVPTLLAYPYGIRNDILFEYAKGMGYTVTLTCRESVNTICTGGTLYELGRFNRPFKESTQEFFSGIFG